MKEAAQAALCKLSMQTDAKISSVQLITQVEKLAQPNTMKAEGTTSKGSLSLAVAIASSNEFGLLQLEVSRTEL
jgi:hypothetical protein